MLCSNKIPYSNMTENRPWRKSKYFTLKIFLHHILKWPCKVACSEGNFHSWENLLPLLSLFQRIWHFFFKRQIGTIHHLLCLLPTAFFHITRTMASTHLYLNSSISLWWIQLFRQSLTLSTSGQSGILWIHVWPGSPCFKTSHLSRTN